MPCEANPAAFVTRAKANDTGCHSCVFGGRTAAIGRPYLLHQAQTTTRGSTLPPHWSVCNASLRSILASIGTGLRPDSCAFLPAHGRSVIPRAATLRRIG